MKHSQKSHSNAGYHNPTVLLFTLLCVLICGSLALSPKAQTKTSDEQDVTPKTLPGRNGKIAFSSYRDGNSDIYTMEADGSDVQRLTALAGSPRWSPDGTKIAFVRGLGIVEGIYVANIYVMNADGTNQTRLTNNSVSDTSPEWSPDGTRIVFESRRQFVATSGNSQIYVMNADGSNQTRLTNNTGLDLFPKWSPDGTRIVFQRYTPPPVSAEIHVMNADGSNQTQLTNSGSALSPRWSPDSSRIAFYSHRDGKAQIYVMNADGSNQTRLTNNPNFDQVPEWSPDGTRIVFQSIRGGDANDIYVMNADGNNQTRLTNNTVYDNLSPIFSPDGTRIAFLSAYSFSGEFISAEISVMNADGSNLVLTNTNVPPEGFDWQVLPQAAANPIDTVDFFVRQHYLDFLNRQADDLGLAFWTNEITSCGADPRCIEYKRINVSAAFYLSIEFQQTGSLVERMYKVAFGDAKGTSTFGGAHQLPVPVVRFSDFLPDTQRIGQGVVVGQGNWQQQLEDNKNAFAAEFVQRANFAAAFPTSMTPAEFVDKLFQNAGVTPSASDRNTAINEFGGAGDTSNLTARAKALRDVAENATLATNEFNRAFVLMQYFGYLRRNPNDPQDTDYTGYDFWLTKLNSFTVPGDDVLVRVQNADMVKAFIVSGEYRGRFGP
jgi:Tol biopolymer transport system component